MAIDRAQSQSKREHTDESEPDSFEPFEPSEPVDSTQPAKRIKTVSHESILQEALNVTVPFQFSSTKNTRVPGNYRGGVAPKSAKALYSQYLNRPAPKGRSQNV